MDVLWAKYDSGTATDDDECEIQALSNEFQGLSDHVEPEEVVGEIIEVKPVGAVTVQ